jgi:hypothetical protein
MALQVKKLVDVSGCFFSRWITMSVSSTNRSVRAMALLPNEPARVPQTPHEIFRIQVSEAFERREPLEERSSILHRLALTIFLHCATDLILKCSARATGNAS